MSDYEEQINEISKARGFVNKIESMATKELLLSDLFEEFEYVSMVLHEQEFIAAYHSILAGVHTMAHVLDRMVSTVKNEQ